MDFGHLQNISRIDFTLPRISPRTAARNSRNLVWDRSPGIPPSVHVGAPIWAQKQWLGRIYPLGTKAADFLPIYARQFNGIELNGTHYHIPTPEQARAWRAETPPGFRFCPKFPQEISHARELEGCEPITRLFCDALAELGDRLGTTFLQLSPYFGPSRLATLARFLGTLPPGFPVCVEFRHPDWFREGALIDAALDVLEAHGAGTVVTDTAGRRDVVHSSLSASRLLVRFVGNALDPTDYSRIDAWSSRAARWLKEGLRELHFFVHQPENDVAPELISYLIERLNAEAGLGLRDWERQDRGLQMSLL